MSGDLGERLEAGDEAGTLALLSALPEPERRKLAKQAAASLKRFETGGYEADEKGTTFTWKSPYTNDQRQSAMLAVLATCTGPELGKVAKSRRLPAEALSLWETLRPTFLDEAAEIVVGASIFNWGLARTLVRRGLSARPRSDNYTLGLVSAEFNPWQRDRTVTLVERVLADPELLKEENLAPLRGGGRRRVQPGGLRQVSWLVGRRVPGAREGRTPLTRPPARRDPRRPRAGLYGVPRRMVLALSRGARADAGRAPRAARCLRAPARERHPSDGLVRTPRDPGRRRGGAASCVVAPALRDARARRDAQGAGDRNVGIAIRHGEARARGMAGHRKGSRRGSVARSQGRAEGDAGSARSRRAGDR